MLADLVFVLASMTHGWLLLTHMNRDNRERAFKLWSLAYTTATTMGGSIWTDKRRGRDRKLPVKGSFVKRMTRLAPIIEL